MGNSDRRIEVNDLPESAGAKLKPDDLQSNPNESANVKGGVRYSGFRYDGTHLQGIRYEGKRTDGIRTGKRYNFGGGGTWKL